MGQGRVPQPALDLGKVLGGSWGGPGRVWGGPWGCWEGPGRVQGWSWEGPRRVLEASSRDLGGQTEPNRTEKWQSCVQRRTYYLQKQNADTKTGTVAGLAACSWIHMTGVHPPPETSNPSENK